MRWSLLSGLTFLTGCVSQVLKISPTKGVIVIASSAGKFTAVRTKAEAYQNLEKQKYSRVYPILKAADVAGPDELFNLAYQGTELGLHLFFNMAQAKEIFPVTYSAVVSAAKDCKVDEPFSMVVELNSGKNHTDKKTEVIFKNGKCYVETK